MGTQDSDHGRVRDVRELAYRIEARREEKRSLVVVRWWDIILVIKSETITFKSLSSKSMTKERKKINNIGQLERERG